MVIFYVSDRHGAVCLSVSCDVLWCLTLSLSPVALGTNPRLSMSFLFWFFFFLFCIHPCCTLLCSPLPPCVLHAGPCGDTCAILLPPARSAQCLASKVTETPLEISQRGPALPSPRAALSTEPVPVRSVCLMGLCAPVSAVWHLAKPWHHGSWARAAGCPELSSPRCLHLLVSDTGWERCAF